MGMKLDLYTHHFSVTEISPVQQNILYEFILPMVQKGLVKVRGRFRPVPLKTFAARKKNRSEFRFHINQYDEFIYLLAQKGYMENDYEVVDHRDSLPKAAKAVFKVKGLPKPYDYQEDIIRYVLEPGISKMVTLQTGRGKALRNNTRIHTPRGLVAIQDLRVGDMVIGANAKPTKVTGVYPQPTPVDIWRMVLSDGRIVYPCKDHQWVVFGEDGDFTTVMTTQDMLDRCDPTPDPKVRQDGKHYLPLTVPHKSALQQHGITPPWLMGLLLKNAVVTSQGATVVIPDMLMDEVQQYTKETKLQWVPVVGRVCTYELYTDKGTVPVALLESFLKETNQGNHIPDYYEYLSESDRMKFLRMYVARSYKYQMDRSVFEYHYLDDTSAAIFQRIIWSMGGVATDNGKCIYYNLQQCHSRIWEGMGIPNDYQWVTKIGVVDWTYVGPADATCIEVEDPTALYITEDYLVTHNTMIAMTCAKRLGTRTIVIVKGGFAPKWKDDWEDAFEFEEGEFMLIKGAAGLKKLLKDATHRRPKLNPSVIVITTRTLANYFKLYELSNGTDKELVVPPHEILPKLKVGFRVMDEVHLEFHFVFRMDLYSHVMKSLSLSATLVSRDEFITKQHDIAYPKHLRNDGGGYIAYIDSTCMFFRLSKPDTVKCMGAQGYSHNEFEMWILADKERTKAYLRLIRKQVQERFVNIHIEGQSYLIFASSVDMCNAIVKDLELHYGTYEVGRYCGSQGDDYTECFLDPDIVVSTLGSAGAAVDKPGLLGTLLTVAVDSIQSVLQMMGRTRQLKGVKNMNPNLVYLTCRDIPKHMEYHKNKIELFKGRVLTHKLEDSNIMI